jgi:CrcB protein
VTPLLFIAIAVAGGLGAAARFVLDGVVRARTNSRTTFPLGTFLINASGSLLLGLVVGLTSSQLLPETLHAIVGAGFLGGYTTFSTASFETVRLRSTVSGCWWRAWCSPPPGSCSARHSVASGS